VKYQWWQLLSSYTNLFRSPRCPCDRRGHPLNPGRLPGTVKSFGSTDAPGDLGLFEGTLPLWASLAKVRRTSLGRERRTQLFAVAVAALSNPPAVREQPRSDVRGYDIVMELRRSPSVTHLCSIRLTHTENTVWRSARKVQAISSKTLRQHCWFPSAEVMHLTHRIQTVVREEAGPSGAIVLLVLLAISGVWAISEASAGSFTSQKYRLAREAYRVAAADFARRESGSVRHLKIAPFSPERATPLSGGRYLVALPYLITEAEETARVQVTDITVNCTTKSCDVSEAKQ